METIALIALAFLLGAGEPTKEDVVYSPSNVTAVQRTYNPSATRISDIIHTDLAISFDWQKQYLHGTAHITVRPYFEATNKLTLDAKGFDIHKVTKEEKELLDSEKEGKGHVEFDDSDSGKHKIAHLVEGSDPFVKSQKSHALFSTNTLTHENMSTHANMGDSHNFLNSCKTWTDVAKIFGSSLTKYAPIKI